MFSESEIKQFNIHPDTVELFAMIAEMTPEQFRNFINLARAYLKDKQDVSMRHGSQDHGNRPSA